MRHIRGAALAAFIFAVMTALPSTASAGVFKDWFGPKSGDCGYTAAKIWKAFLPFGDKADYWLAPGGDFETKASGWQLDNARVVNGNENEGVVKGKKSLALGMGLVALRGTAVSPTFCVTDEHPTFRFMYKANGPVGLLSTFVRYTAADGSTREQAVHSRTAVTLLPGKWVVSDLQPLATAMPMKRIGGVAKIQLVFKVPLSALGAGYQIDSVLVDPYRTR